MRYVIAALFCAAFMGSCAAASDVKLSGDRYWVALASRQNLDEAISYARRYSGLQPSVISSVNGWYAIVVGPRTIAQGAGRPLLDSLAKISFIPKDAYLTRGEGYSQIEWRSPPSPIIARASYDGKADAVLENGHLRLVLSSVRVDGNDRAPKVTGWVDGRPAFTMVAGRENPSEIPTYQVSLVQLDQSSPEPQVMLTYFWQGAHCCTVTTIATLLPGGSWAIVNGGALDGASGYRLEDLTRTGEVDLVSPDQDFFYAFASYASSNAPTRVHRLVGDHLEDVTAEPRFHQSLIQVLAGMQDGIQPSDPAWGDNGSLAGWVAAKMLVGQGRDAWSRMLASYDHDPDFGPEECATNAPIANCPDEKKIKVDFPKALKDFLATRKYILDASLYPVPERPLPVAQATPGTGAPVAVIPPALRQCVASSDTVRKLILQSFMGRKLRSDEGFGEVSLENDTTLEENDQSIGRLVCAVTYDLPLKPLIGRLAENGDFRRAEVLDRLMRRGGPTASTRVKYSVKPTATPGETFIELLP